MSTALQEIEAKQASIDHLRSVIRTLANDVSAIQSACTHNDVLKDSFDVHTLQRTITKTCTLCGRSNVSYWGNINVHTHTLSINSLTGALQGTFIGNSGNSAWIQPTLTAPPSPPPVQISPPPIVHDNSKPQPAQKEWTDAKIFIAAFSVLALIVAIIEFGTSKL